MWLYVGAPIFCIKLFLPHQSWRVEEVMSPDAPSLDTPASVTGTQWPMLAVLKKAKEKRVLANKIQGKVSYVVSVPTKSSLY